MDKCKQCNEDLPINHAQVGGVHITCEHAYTNDKTERMIKMRPGKGYPFAIVSPSEAAQLVEFLDPREDGYEISATLMTKLEVNSLPEFKGW
jgi:hypothetical protein